MAIVLLGTDEITGSAEVGAQSVSLTPTTGSTAALIGVHCFRDTAGQDLSALSLDGQTLTHVATVEPTPNNGRLDMVLYEGTGFSTGSAKTLAYTVDAAFAQNILHVTAHFLSGTDLSVRRDIHVAPGFNQSFNLVDLAVGDYVYGATYSKANASMTSGQDEYTDTRVASSRWSLTTGTVATGTSETLTFSSFDGGALATAYAPVALGGGSKAGVLAISRLKKF